MKFKKVKHLDIPGCAHELTFSCIKKQDFFMDKSLCRWFVRDLGECRDRGMFKILAYVLMPNHVHLLVIPGNDDIKISKILGSVKMPLTRRIMFNRSDYKDLLMRMKDESANRIIHRFWQRGGGYDRNLASKKAILASIDYIHGNPVRRGLVETAEDWKWSSAGFYFGKQDYSLRMDNEMLGVFI